MISIGNDIVAIGQPDSRRASNERFYRKILLPEEVEEWSKTGSLVKIPLYQYVWLCWSVKESIYKCAKRIFPEPGFSPLKIVLQQAGLPKRRPVSFPDIYEERGLDDALCWQWRAGFKDHSFFARSLMTGAWIHSFASTNDDFSNLYWGIQRIESNDYELQSASLRSFFLERMKNIYPGCELSVGEGFAGNPVLIKDGVEDELSFSFSHHEFWVGYGMRVTIDDR